MAQTSRKFIQDLAINAAKLDSNAVTTDKIANDAVTGDKIADNVALAGAPTTTTASAGDNTTKIATTAFVKTALDNAIEGLDVKQSVRAASTADVPLTGGATLSVDGVSLANSNRVLLKDQTDAEENGIYTVSGIGTTYSLARSSDADEAADFTAGLFTFVEEGTANADTGWVLSTNDPITLDTTELAFAQFSSAGVIVAGDGLTKTGNTLDVGAGDGIDVSADSIAVDVSDFAGTGIEDDGSNNLRIAASAAGDGLIGGGGSALAVGAGDGIDVAADAISVDVGDLAGAGLENDGSNNLRIAASAAGAGLTGGAGSALAVGAGSGITVNANDVAVNPDGATVKNNGSSQVEALKHREEENVLDATDITNQYVDLAHAVWGTSASVNSVQLYVVGGPLQRKAVDYTVSLTGGAGGVTRITFDGDLETGGDAALVDGDVLVISYDYLT